MWLFLALFAYLLFALVVSIDRHLLISSIPNPFSYAFYVGIFAGFLLLAAPFFIEFSPIDSVLLAILSGIIFFIAVLFLYSAFRVGEVSRLGPASGAIGAIATLVFARIFTAEALNLTDLMAFLLLLTGGMLISLHTGGKYKFKQNELLLVLGAGIGFALGWVIRKNTFSDHPFFSVILWSDLGVFLGALFLFAIPRTRREILRDAPKIQQEKRTLFLLNQVLGGIAGLTLNYSVKLGSVTLVNALQGTENLFILAITFLFAKRYPHFLKEEFGKGVIWQKLIAVLCIGAGLAILAQRVF